MYASAYMSFFRLYTRKYRSSIKTFISLLKLIGYKKASELAERDGNRMGKNMVQFMNVSKEFRSNFVLKNCNLTLEKGKIYGLVGRNGAGKTTMMRMIAGLSIPSEGTIECRTTNMGTLIEEPSLNGNMTARENLKFFRMLCKNGEKGLSDEELLTLVGLNNIEKKKTKDFSLGMRQRLGIAIALLGNPEFLMLDEPVNGLDPLGVLEIRNLIKQLNENYQMTIFISSHNLAELYQTATNYIIIDNGVIKKEVSQEQLEKENDGNLEEFFLSVIQ